MSKLLKNFTLRQLQAFIEVANSGSITKAAENLFITQPAVSMQIRQLEEVFGISLVEPIGRNIQLTEAGREFLRQAEQATAQLANLEIIVAEHIGIKKGALNLALVNTAKYFVPMLLVKFRRIYEGVQINLKIGSRDAVLAMLERSEVDLAIVGHAATNTQICSEPFVTNPQGFISAPSHPLSRSKKISLRTISEYPFILRELSSDTRMEMERIFSQHKLNINAIYELPSNEMIKQAVMAEMGLSFLSLRTVRREMASGHLAILDVIDTPLIGNWYVAHLKQRRLSPSAIAFKDFILEQGAPLIESWA